MATAAQIANDLAAQAAFWTRRDAHVAGVCRDAARLIRAMLAGQPVDGRTYAGVQARLMSNGARYRTSNETIAWSLQRASEALMHLRAVAS